MQILHISAECYPAAKVGGLADVTGSLPKYLNDSGQHCEVLIPKYETEWITLQKFDIIFEGTLRIGNQDEQFSIQRLTSKDLGFPLLVVDIPGKFDRPGVYIDPWSGHAYWDEFERFLSFQIAALEWLLKGDRKPDIIHCHDHHTGLIPFMVKQCNRFRELEETPTILTVHNAEYHGTRNREDYTLLPAFNIENIGLLDWNGELNSLAAGLKCAWKITTVSETYMNELSDNSNGLEKLFENEAAKSTGILNGIDTEIWDPSTDEYLDIKYSYRNRKSGKHKNKIQLCQKFGLNPALPTIVFIGRLVREKGADLLPDLFKSFMKRGEEVNFILLGTGDPQLHRIFENMQSDHIGYFDATLKYNEKLAHQMYAGADFILMPSRVEPCGLNQMFAMRYGTIPIVRGVGGLKDTVVDISKQGGYGIIFNDFILHEAEDAIRRAIALYHNSSKLREVIGRVMKLDFSWKRSAQEYLKVYQSLKALQNE